MTTMTATHGRIHTAHHGFNPLKWIVNAFATQSGAATVFGLFGRQKWLNSGRRRFGQVPAAPRSTRACAPI